MDKLKCSNCKHLFDKSAFHERKGSRGVSYICKKCRSERNRFGDIFNAMLKKYKKLCQRCKMPKKTFGGICQKCLKLSGLRACNQCNQILLEEFEFYPNRGKCKKCLK